MPSRSGTPFRRPLHSGRFGLFWSGERTMQGTSTNAGAGIQIGTNKAKRSQSSRETDSNSWLSAFPVLGAAK